MTKKYPGNIPASVKQRLFNISHERSVDFQIIWRRYAFERLLWNAFMNKGKFKNAPDSFERLGTELRNFLELPIHSVKASEKTNKIWSGSKWQNE